MYFQLDSDEAAMTAFITPIDECSGSLIRGRMIDSADENLPFRYSYRAPAGKPLFDFYSGDCIMSKSLVATLESAGVDNLQKFETELIDEDSGNIRKDYWTVNIIGMISCAKISESKSIAFGNSFYFRDLVIDSNRVNGALMFRVKESMTDILIHEKVADAVKSGDFVGLVLSPARSAP